MQSVSTTLAITLLAAVTALSEARAQAEIEAVATLTSNKTQHVTLARQDVTLKTEFGILTIPLSKVATIHHAESRSAWGNDDEAKRAEKLMLLLGSDDKGERERAQINLFDLGRAAVPVLKKGAESDDEAVADECRKLLGELRARGIAVDEGVEEDKIITTNNMVLAGRITNPNYKIITELSGALDVPLAKLRSLSFVPSRIRKVLLPALLGSPHNASDKTGDWKIARPRVSAAWTSIKFDDSQWKAPMKTHDAFYYPATNWHKAETGRFHLRRTFVLEEVPREANLMVGRVTSYVLRVNGAHIEGGGTGQHDVTEHLNIGWNLIAIEYETADGLAYVNLTLENK